MERAETGFNRVLDARCLGNTFIDADELRRAGVSNTQLRSEHCSALSVVPLELANEHNLCMHLVSEYGEFRAPSEVFWLRASPTARMVPI